MAKKKGKVQQIILEGAGGVQYFTSRNVQNTPEKLKLKKYNPKTRQHEEFQEKKNKFK